MKDNGDLRHDVKLPDNEIGKEIQEKFDNDEQIMVTILKAMSTEAAIATKAMTKDKQNSKVVQEYSIPDAWFVSVIELLMNNILICQVLYYIS